MTLVNRRFSYERDLDSVRNFLSEIFRLTGSLHYLIPTKIENHKYGPCGPSYTKKDNEDIQIWQKTTDSKNSSLIIAVSHRGSAGNYHIEIHPAYKKLEGENEKLKEELMEIKEELSVLRTNTYWADGGLENKINKHIFETIKKIQDGKLK